MEEVRCDTRDSLLLTAYSLLDTVHEVTTITIQLNEQGDTLRREQITDRTSVRDRTMTEVRSKKEGEIIHTDTVYVEKESASSPIAVAGSSTEITPDGAIRQKGVILKWIFWILIAIIILIFTLKIFR